MIMVPIAELRDGQLTAGTASSRPEDVVRLSLVKIARMDNPPKQFVAGSDALAVVKPALEARLEELRANEGLSKSTDGAF